MIVKIEDPQTLYKKNVLWFWKTRKSTFPILTNLAQMLLASVATSVPSETLFSASGYQLWDRRNGISPENRNDNVHLQK